MELASDVLLPKSTTVVVGGQAYPISSFCFAKAVLATDLVVTIAEVAGLSHLLNGGLAEASDNVLLGKESSILSQVFNVVPALLRQGIKPVYQLIGLIVTSNEELESLTRSGANVLEACYDTGMTIGWRGSIEDVKKIVGAGLDSLANEPIIKAIPNALGVWVQSLIQASTPA